MKKLSSLLNRIKVQKQLYIIYFIAIFLPVIMIGNYLIYNTRSMLFSHYEEQSYSDNLRIKSILLDLTSNVYEKAQTLASDPQLIQILSKDSSSSKKNSQNTEDYTGFHNLLAQDSSIHDISVYTFNTSVPEGTYIHQITEKIKKEPWYKQATNSVTPFWTREIIQDDFGNPKIVLSFHTRIFLPLIKSYAIMNVYISDNHLKNRIENSSLNTALWLDQEDFFYCSNKNLQNKDLIRYQDAHNNTYLGKLQLNQGNVIGCVSSFTPYYSDNIFYMASLNQEGLAYINKITQIHIVILLIILIVTSAFIYAFSSYFGHRITALRETMHNVSHGNYAILDTFQGTDEISEVFKDLNVMVQDILKKEASVYEAKICTQKLINQQQKMEFKMLSNQINPHFLYNTLETIRMRSLKAGNYDVANAVKLLGKSMRYVLENTTTSFTLLSKEINYINIYIAIQKLRFHERISYTFRAPNQMDLADYQILPLLLQPIVENAIIHGLEDVEQNGHIIIHIREKEQTLFIDIFDNGCGMSPNELAEMNQTIYHHKKDSSKSIGLYNINQRIQLCYGTAYGMQIKSKKQWGTLVTLTLPIQHAKEEIYNESIHCR